MSVLVANRTVPSVSARIDMVEINGFQVMVFEVAKSRKDSCNCWWQGIEKKIEG